jgi:hypothetical protein
VSKIKHPGSRADRRRALLRKKKIVEEIKANPRGIRRITVEQEREKELQDELLRPYS